MRNEKKGRYAGRFMPVYIIAIIYAFLLLAFCGCRQSREMVQTQTSFENTTTATGSDTTTAKEDRATADTVRETHRGFREDDGQVFIRRDSQGLPVFIWWHETSAFEDIFAHEDKARGAITTEAISGRLAVSTSSGSATERTEEEKQEPLRTSEVIECYVGTALMTLMLIYIIYVFWKDQGVGRWLTTATKRLRP